MQVLPMDDEFSPLIENEKKGLTLRKGKIVVEITKDGIPYGSWYNSLLKNIGKLVRTMIPITYNDWRKVPTRHIDTMWEYVEVKPSINIKFIFQLIY